MQTILVNRIFFSFTNIYILKAKTLIRQTKIPTFYINNQLEEIILSTKSQLLESENNRYKYI